MKTLRELIHNAELKKIAIGHFNFSNFEQLKAIVSVAARLKLPVILGLSEGEREFIGVRQAVAVVKSFREEFNIPIFLNADHTYSLEKVREAAEAGFDSIIFDGAKLSFEENIAKTCEAVKIAKKTRRDILVEGEFGYIGQSSQVLKEVPKGAQVRLEDLSKVSECVDFIKRTGIDLFAPAVGNFHGIVVAPGIKEKLNIKRIREIKDAVKIPLVLHGGSGIGDSDFRAGIKSGISIVHISTELRVAWRGGLEKSLKEKPDESAPYKLLQNSFLGVQKVVEGRLKLFSKI